jgi:hypothetical protein
MDNAEERFRRAFGLIAFAMNRHLAQHMRRLSRELESDLDAAFVWATLAHLNALKILRPGADRLDVSGSGDMLRSELNPVRLSDVAQVTGLPRETVRRKLALLRERGRAERTADGRWCFRPEGIDETAYAFTREMARNLLQTAAEVQRLLDRAGEPAP